MSTKSVEEMLDEVLDALEDAPYAVAFEDLSREVNSYWIARKHYLREQRERLREQALAKLTYEERKALGL